MPSGMATPLKNNPTQKTFSAKAARLIARGRALTESIVNVTAKRMAVNNTTKTELLKAMAATLTAIKKRLNQKMRLIPYFFTTWLIGHDSTAERSSTATTI